MAIPPGPQIPFDSNRTYGQQPGFISKHSGKLFVGLIILILVLVAVFTFTVILPDEDDHSEFKSSLSTADLVT